MKRGIICSVSGGKDSTATFLLALERGHTPRAVFADTGHEHPATYNYVRELAAWSGVEIEWIRADFSHRFAAKRKTIETKWRAEGIPEETVLKALEALHPTGNPYLDLCMLKGRFPSSKAQFCTDELKVQPIRRIVLDEMMESFDRVESWVGVRADESLHRSTMTEWQCDVGNEADPINGEGLWLHRPILKWSADDVFAYIAKRDAPLNPLYRQGMGRVGCMPCINARKGELREIATRFPEEIARVAEWERIVSLVSKRGSATFLPAVNDPTVGASDDIRHDTHGIHRMVAWANTSRGGRQYMLDEPVEVSQCASIYQLCE